MKKKVGCILVCLFVTAGVCGAFFISGPDQTPEKKIAGLYLGGEVISVTFSADSKYVIGGSYTIDDLPKKYWQGRVKVWEVETGKGVASADLPQHIISLSASK